MLQEIKFEPYVMCERIDKKLTFHSSQVYKRFTFLDLLNCRRRCIKANTAATNLPNKLKQP